MPPQPHISYSLWLAWLDFIQMSGGIRKKLQMTQYAIYLFNKNIVKPFPGVADVVVLPIAVLDPKLSISSSYLSLNS